MTLPDLLAALSERIAAPAADLTAADLDALRALIPATEAVLGRHLPPWHEAEYGTSHWLCYRGNPREPRGLDTPYLLIMHDGLSHYAITGAASASVPKSAGLDFAKAVADLLAQAAGYVLVDE